MPKALAFSSEIIWLYPVHGNIRPDVHNLFRKLFAYHVRHGLVSDDQVKLVRLRLEGLKRLNAVGSGHYLIAEPLKGEIGMLGGGILYTAVAQASKRCQPRQARKEKQD